MTSSEPARPISERSSLYPDSELRSHEIRLVVLQPGQGNEVPRCELIKYNLSIDTTSYSPEYAALSYAWGSAENPQTIILAGQEVQVTANLYAALRSVRRHDRVRAGGVRRSIRGRAGKWAEWLGYESLLWIDALCIDQSSALERAHQVSLMPRIYGLAAEVFIWLGDKGSESSIEKRPLPSSLSHKLSNVEKPVHWDHDYEANAFKILDRLAEDEGQCIDQISFFQNQKC